MQKPDYETMNKDELNALIQKINDEFASSNIGRKAELYFQYCIAKEYLRIVDLEEKIQDSRNEIKYLNQKLSSATELAF